VVSAPNAFRRFVPGLIALGAYDRAWLRDDLVAGVSVAAVAVPIAIAYSQLAGVPPVNGLYASILPLVAYAVFGTSRQLIVAPDAATCAIIASVVMPLAGGDPVRHVSLAMTLAVITGVLCIAAGLGRLGFLANFLSRPILAGYLNGIAISIITGQLGKLSGVPLTPAGFFRQISEFGARLGEVHGWTLAVGLVAFAGLRALKHLAPKVPAPLIAVVVAIAASRFFGLAGHGVAVLGSIPAGLPGLTLPHIAVDDLLPLAYGAVGLALISFNSAMVTARGFAVKNRYDIDPNQEFIALGVADIGAGALQGFAVSGADSRTAVNDAVGGKSQVTGLVAAVLLVLTLLFFTGPLASLPIAVLAAILISSAIGLFDVQGLVTLRKTSRREFRLAIVTLLGVITVGVLPGVVVAITIALVQLLANASRPHDAVLGRIAGVDGYYNLRRRPEAEPLPGVVIFRWDAPLVFFNADRFKSRVRSVAAESRMPVRYVVIDAESMPQLDSTGAAALGELHTELAGRRIGLAIAGEHGQLSDMLDRSLLRDQIGAHLCVRTLDDAVAQLAQLSSK
jgi:high affinity sulfate transporter 1